MPRGGQAPHEWPEKKALRVCEVAIEHARHAPTSVYILLPLILFTVEGVLITVAKMRVFAVVLSHP